MPDETDDDLISSVLGHSWKARGRITEERRPAFRRPAARSIRENQGGGDDEGSLPSSFGDGIRAGKFLDPEDLDALGVDENDSISHYKDHSGRTMEPEPSGASVRRASDELPDSMALTPPHRTKFNREVPDEVFAANQAVFGILSSSDETTSYDPGSSQPAPSKPTAAPAAPAPAPAPQVGESTESPITELLRARERMSKPQDWANTTPSSRPLQEDAAPISQQTQAAPAVPDSGGDLGAELGAVRRRRKEILREEAVPRISPKPKQVESKAALEAKARLAAKLGALGGDEPSRGIMVGGIKI